VPLRVSGGSVGIGVEANRIEITAREPDLYFSSGDWFASAPAGAFNAAPWLQPER
jgi:hypothetical protein